MDTHCESRGAWVNSSNWLEETPCCQQDLPTTMDSKEKFGESDPFPVALGYSLLCRELNQVIPSKAKALVHRHWQPPNFHVRFSFAVEFELFACLGHLDFIVS